MARAKLAHPYRHAFLLLFWALVCSTLAATAAVVSYDLWSPASDSADGSFAFELRDPVVVTMGFYGLVGGIVGWVCAVFALRPSEVRRAVPEIVAATVLTAAITAPLLHLFAAIPTLVVGVMVMSRNRRHPRAAGSRP